METSDALRLGKGGLSIVYRKTGIEPEIIEEIKPEIIQEAAKVELIEFMIRLDRIENKLELLQSMTESILIKQSNTLKLLEVEPKGIRTFFKRVIEWFRN